MTAYRWQPEVLTDVFVLPAGVVDTSLTTASPEALRVLLWLSRNRLHWDAAACADAVGLSPAACETALAYWVGQGVLAAPTQAAAPLARPAAVKPRAQEVLAYQQRHPDFSAFVELASARLGKVIGHGDVATLLYLLDTVGLPQDVILTEIAYAVAIGKANMHYVEKIALDWADKELVTLEAVDAHIQYMERCHRAGERVETLLGLKRSLNIPQREMACKWIENWGFSEEMIRLAAAISTENTGKFSPAYVDGVLKRWQAEGIDTPEKANAAAPVKKKGPAATNPAESSLDTDEFDQALLRYRPQFKNEKK